MERHEVLARMAALKLTGMRAAYDEVVSEGIKRQHAVHRMIGALLEAEAAERRARSIRYRLGIAKLPLAKDLDDFDFAAAPVNEPLVRELHGGGFLETQRNFILIGGTGTGKTHLAIAIAANCIRNDTRGRFFNSLPPT